MIHLELIFETIGLLIILNILLAIGDAIFKDKDKIDYYTNLTYSVSYCFCYLQDRW